MIGQLPRWAWRAGVFCAVGVAMALAVSPARAEDAVWKPGVTGIWHQSNNWVGGVVPMNDGTLYDVFVDNGGAGDALAVVDPDVRIETLTISPGDTVRVPQMRTLTLEGGLLSNAGTLRLHGGTFGANLQLDSTTIVSGGGEIDLSTSLDNRIHGPGLLANRDNLIHGAGQIAIALENTATVRASGPSVLSLTEQDKTNDGWFESYGEGTLRTEVGVYGTGGWRAIGGKIQVDSTGFVFTEGPISLQGGELEINGGFMGGSDVTMSTMTRLDMNANAVLVASSSFLYRQKDPALWSWDASAELMLAGGWETTEVGWEGWVPLEVGGADLGDVPAGHSNNFALPTLTLDDDSHVVLSDLYTNRTGLALEALYVHRLVLGSGSVLNLNGLNLYYDILEGDGTILDELVSYPPAIPGDADRNGVVDDRDLNIVLSHWGETTTAGWRSGDFDDSAYIDDRDLNILLAHWGDTELAAVPEPTALALLAGAAVALRRRR